MLRERVLESWSEVKGDENNVHVCILPRRGICTHRESLRESFSSDHHLTLPQNLKFTTVKRDQTGRGTVNLCTLNSCVHIIQFNEFYVEATRTKTRTRNRSKTKRNCEKKNKPLENSNIGPLNIVDLSN